MAKHELSATEFEAKFLDADHASIRAMLRELNATLQHPMRLMHRALLDYPDERLHTARKLLRVRDEGDKTTLTFKHFAAAEVDGTGELETTVGDYQTTIALLQALGLVVTSRQESKRERWHLGRCEVTLEERPWVKPFIEIEAPSETVVRRVARQLGYVWSAAVFGSVEAVYQAEYRLPPNIPPTVFSEVRFDLPVPESLRKLKKEA